MRLRPNQFVWADVVNGAHLVHMIGEGTTRLMIVWKGDSHKREALDDNEVALFKVFIVHTNSSIATEVDTFMRDTNLAKEFGHASAGCQEWATRVVEHWKEDNIGDGEWEEIYS